MRNLLLLLTAVVCTGCGGAGVVLEAAAPRGLFRPPQTLRQLLPPLVEGGVRATAARAAGQEGYGAGGREGQAFSAVAADRTDPARVEAAATAAGPSSSPVGWRIPATPARRDLDDFLQRLRGHLPPWRALGANHPVPEALR